MRKNRLATSTLMILIAYLPLVFLALAAQENTQCKLNVPLGLDAFSIVIPEDNLLTEEKIELGRLLFFEKQLSADNAISCANCHDPKFAFADGKPVSIGVGGRKGIRSAPTVINRLFSSRQFWDGKAESLEEQAKGPLINPLEMGHKSYDEVVERLNRIKGYSARFEKAFGIKDFTIDHVAKAIACFERTLLSGNSPFDKFEAGGDESALSESARRGLVLFRAKARCSLCHSGFNFTDELFHNLGVGFDKPEKEHDLGLYNVTKRAEDKGKFKTPTLREITRTTPYMHDGRFKTLEEVIDFYDKGGIENANLDPEIMRLKLTAQEKKDLVEFLKTLEGEGWQYIKAPEKFPE